MQSLARSFTGEVLLVSSTRSDKRGTSTVDMFGAVTWLAVLVSPAVYFIMVALTVDSRLAGSTAAFAAAALFQDGIRVYLIKEDRSGVLLFFGCASAVLQPVLILVAGAMSGEAYAAVIAAAGVVASLVLAAIAVRLVRIDLAGGIRWLHLHSSMGSAYFLEVLSGALSGYSLMVFLDIFSGPVAVAAYRATVSLYGLTSILINFARVTILRDLVARVNMGANWSVVRTSAQLGLFFLVGVSITFCSLLAVPNEVGSRLLGDVWWSVQPLLLLGALSRLAASFSVIPTIVLRASGVTWRATWIRVVIGVVGMASAPFAVITGGAGGAFILESAVYLCLAIVLGIVLVRSLRLPGTGA
ncbi:hypothetical protein ACVGVM_27085 [Pseudonocardia bannensis]|uniref:O-antigen/teichoic acid export membrane protein n=1 Tax=Pseudonocardia bannensis TaxID=630973 RepID=A0A848DGV7_9PSEU|nr:hypothetical protein [Pseudonocardia bannensis]NMH91912.1 hypothetical protein [Pseudonocardia bannensis]